MIVTVHRRNYTETINAETIPDYDARVKVLNFLVTEFYERCELSSMKSRDVVVLEILEDGTVLLAPYENINVNITSDCKGFKRILEIMEKHRVPPEDRRRILTEAIEAISGDQQKVRFEVDLSTAQRSIVQQDPMEKVYKKLFMAYMENKEQIDAFCRNKAVCIYQADNGDIKVKQMDSDDAALSFIDEKGFDLFSDPRCMILSSPLDLNPVCFYKLLSHFT